MFVNVLYALMKAGALILAILTVVTILKLIA